MIENPSTNAKAQQKIHEMTSLYTRWKLDWAEKQDESEDMRNFVLDSRKQWTDTEKAILDKKGRTYVAVNVMMKYLNQLAGLYHQNKREVRAIDENGDHAVSERMTKLLKYVNETQNDMNQKLLKMFNEGNIMEIGGWIRLYYGWKGNEPQIVLQNREALAMILDPDCREYDLSDALGIFDTEFYSVEQLIAMFPEFAEDIHKLSQREMPKNQSRWKSWWSTLTDKAGIDHDDRYGVDFMDKSSGKFRLLQFNYVKQEVLTRIFDGRERVTYYQEHLDERKMVAIKAAMADEPGRFQFTKTRTKVHYLAAAIPAMDLLLFDKPQSCQTGTFEYFRYAPYDIAGKLIDNVSFFTNIKDLQREKNRRRSVALDFLNRISIPKLIYKRDSMDPDEVDKFLSGEIEAVQYDFGEKPQFDVVQNSTLEHVQHEDIINRDFEDITSVTGSIQGQSKSEDNATLYALKKEQGVSGITPVLKNLERTRLLIAKAELAMIQMHYVAPFDFFVQDDRGNSERVYMNIPMREVGKPGYTIMNDVQAGKLDIRLLDTNYSETTKQRNLAVTIELLRLMPPELVPYDLIFDMVDLGEDTEEWKARVKAVMTSSAEQAEKERLKQDMIDKYEIAADAKQRDMDAKLKAAEVRKNNKKEAVS